VRRLVLLAIVTVFLAMPCVSAFAEESAAKKKAEELPWDKASISLGSFISSSNSNIRLSANGLGIGIATELFYLEVEAEGEDYPAIDFTGKLEYQYLGAMLYGKVYF